MVAQEGRLRGYNTDVSGFASALSQGLEPTPGELRVVTQLGVGGAGSATAAALLNLGTRTLNLFDLDAQRAIAKAQQLAELYPGATVRAVTKAELAEALAASTGLVNATPIGMHHHPGAPLPLGYLHPQLWVFDVIYLPQKTLLIQKARSIGCRVLPGGLMAVGQAADAFELITGLSPDRAELLTHFKRLLAAQGNQLT